MFDAVGPWENALAAWGPLGTLQICFGGLSTSGGARERGRGVVLLRYELHGGALGLGLSGPGVGKAGGRLLHGCAGVRPGAGSVGGLVHGLWVVNGVSGHGRAVRHDVRGVAVRWPGVGGLCGRPTRASRLRRGEGRYRWVRCVLGRLGRLPGLGML